MFNLPNILIQEDVTVTFIVIVVVKWMDLPYSSLKILTFLSQPKKTNWLMPGQARSKV